MGTYHTFFVATEAHVARLFPGWTPPEPKGAPPAPLGRPSYLDDEWGPAVPPLVPPADDYSAYIEGACPPGLRACPHFRAKNVVDYAFTCLGELAPLLVEGEEATPALLRGPKDDDDVPFVWTLSATATAKLAALGSDQLVELGGRVGEQSLEGPGDDDGEALAEHLLAPLAALAREAVRTAGRLCELYALHH